MLKTKQSNYLCLDNLIVMSKTVLITGAAGFLGSHLCDRFIAEGFQVIGMDNYITGDQDNIQHLFDLPNFEFIEHDVTNLSLIHI